MSCLFITNSVAQYSHSQGSGAPPPPPDLVTTAVQQITADSQSLSCGTTEYASYTLQTSTSGGAINLTSNPQVVDGVNEQLCMLCGTSDTDYVIIEDGTGLDLRSSLNLQNKVCVGLQFHAGDDLWRELWRTPLAQAIGGTDTQLVFIDGASPSGDTGLTFNKTTNVLTVSGGLVSTCDAATQECGLVGMPVETADPVDTTDSGTGTVILRTNVGLQSRQGNATTKTYIHDAGGQTIAGTLAVAAEAYDATDWNGDTTVPQKDAIRDKIEALEIVDSYMPFGCDEGDGTAYLRLAMNTTCSGTEVYSQEVFAPVMRAGVVKYLTCNRAAATGSGNTRTFTVRVNATTTTNAVCTMANAATCTVSNGTTAVVAGDNLSIIAQETAGTPAETQIVCSVGVRVAP